MLNPNCQGCDNLTEITCSKYENPEAQWKYNRKCGSRTHNKTIPTEKEFKLNPLKASKRGAKQ